MGFSLKIFVYSGESEGPRVIEKSNWTGRGLALPRSLFAGVHRREESIRATLPLPKLISGEVAGGKSSDQRGKPHIRPGFHPHRITRRLEEQWDITTYPSTTCVILEHQRIQVIFGCMTNLRRSQNDSQ